MSISTEIQKDGLPVSGLEELARKALIKRTEAAREAERKREAEERQELRDRLITCLINSGILDRDNPAFRAEDGPVYFVRIMDARVGNYQSPTVRVDSLTFGLRTFTGNISTEHLCVIKTFIPPADSAEDEFPCELAYPVTCLADVGAYFANKITGRSITLATEEAA